ncbi:MAG TPA: hypothetical protein VK846_11985 [Candidatus Limnocylindria bacterium]|nr:hypothetical protein [Candidatus Limnocylindria bacterium]
MKKRQPEQLSERTRRRIAVGAFKESRWELPVKVRIGTLEVSEAAGVLSRRVWLLGPPRRPLGAMVSGAF